MQSLIVSLLLLTLHEVECQSDPALLDVYPDPTDPEVLQGRTPLHFALILSFSDPFVSSGSLAGIKVALDRINNDTSLLPGYTLHYALTDCKVSILIIVHDFLVLFCILSVTKHLA